MLSAIIIALISVISFSSNTTFPYTNYSCQQLDVFIPSCLLYYHTFIQLFFSTYLFTRRKAYSDRIIPSSQQKINHSACTHIIQTQRARLNYRWPLSPQICISLAFPLPVVFPFFLECLHTLPCVCVSVTAE